MKNKRERLIESALYHFKVKGYHQTRIEDITDKAQTGKGTFYLYFKSKEHLVLDVFDLLTKEIAKTLEMAVEGLGQDQNLMNIFEKQAECLTATLSQNKAAASFILKEGRSASAKLNERMHEFIAQLISMTVETFELAQSMNLISKFDPKIMAIQMVGGIFLTYELWLNEQLDMPTETIHQHILGYALKGLNLDEKRLSHLMENFQ